MPPEAASEVRLRRVLGPTASTSFSTSPSLLHAKHKVPTEAWPRPKQTAVKVANLRKTPWHEDLSPKGALQDYVAASRPGRACPVAHSTSADPSAFVFGPGAPDPAPRFLVWSPFLPFVLFSSSGPRGVCTCCALCQYRPRGSSAFGSLPRCLFLPPPSALPLCRIPARHHALLPSEPPAHEDRGRPARGSTSSTLLLIIR